MCKREERKEESVRDRNREAVGRAREKEVQREREGVGRADLPRICLHVAATRVCVP